MKKSCLLLLTLSLVALLPRALHAQASAAATRGGIAQIGVAYSNSNQDEYTKRLQGITIYGTFELTNHLGVEGDVHLASALKSYYGYKETSADVGLRYTHRVRRYSPYGKALVGFGHSSAPSPNQIVGANTPGTYMLYSLGGGLDYRLSDRFNLRAVDFEYQNWPNFAPHGLTPSILSFGVAYRLR
ncbi:MAG TPA: outer membrane beta-barrel protein [Acidobacteriaceae bacterium]|jgi:opacity protein-like surface antigen|nr:outer membrane beta-barrel protein [Acidobacteriaceae bacterium]